MINKIRHKTQEFQEKAENTASGLFDKTKKAFGQSRKFIHKVIGKTFENEIMEHVEITEKILLGIYNDIDLLKKTLEPKLNNLEEATKLLSNKLSDIDEVKSKMFIIEDTLEELTSLNNELNAQKELLHKSNEQLIVLKDKINYFDSAKLKEFTPQKLKVLYGKQIIYQRMSIIAFILSIIAFILSILL